ncbi:hypothetical protein VNO77_26994 [Canavalia gladiata]|uniref:Uncharacterized protein n=1 Tax=Canavalia gladiata TaxID=3824 RepID=A0AAN9KTV2_CANGL
MSEYPTPGYHAKGDRHNEPQAKCIAELRWGLMLLLARPSRLRFTRAHAYLHASRDFYPKALGFMSLPGETPDDL